jgi:broad specificity phosphatase PhoE
MHSIYLLRHAQTPYNAHNLIIGGRSCHLPLSSRGEQEAISAGNFFKQQALTFDKVFCSTANRTKSTLELIQSQYRISDTIIYSDEILELAQGEWEGRLRSEIYTKERLAEIDTSPLSFKAPNGESRQEVEERMLRFIQKNIITPHTTGNFLIIAHGVAFKCLLRGILDISSQMAFRLSIDNVSLTKVRYDQQKKWHLDYLNQKIISNV